MVVCVEGLLLLFLVGLLPLCLRDVALNVLLRSVWDKDICQGCPSRYLNNFGGVLVVAKTQKQPERSHFFGGTTDTVNVYTVLGHFIACTRTFLTGVLSCTSRAVLLF